MKTKDLETMMNLVLTAGAACSAAVQAAQDYRDFKYEIQGECMAHIRSINSRITNTEFIDNEDVGKILEACENDLKNLKNEYGGVFKKIEKAEKKKKLPYRLAIIKNEYLETQMVLNSIKR